LVGAGVFERGHIGPIRGVILEMTPQGVPHSATIQRLTRLLVPPLVGRADVRVQMSFVAGDDSLPEPDLAVVSPVLSEVSHPSQAFLIIEVANTALKYDRGVKAELYAQFGVPEYWIVNVVDRVVERHSQPKGDAYQRIDTFRSGDRVTLSAFPDVSLEIAGIFGG